MVHKKLLMIEAQAANPHPQEKDNCPFCKIMSGKEEGFIIKADRRTVVLLSLEGHPLVVPKEHLGIADLTPNLRADMGKIALSLLQQIPEIYGAQGGNLFMTYGRSAGQEVYHAHIHVIPRFDQDHLHPFRNLVAKTYAERRSIANKF